MTTHLRRQLALDCYARPRLLLLRCLLQLLYLRAFGEFSDILPLVRELCDLLLDGQKSLRVADLAGHDVAD